jgi:hypothetical protein
MYDQMIQATLAGQGVALGRSPLIDSLLRQRKLVAPFSQTMASPRSYYLIQSAAALRKPEVQSFIEWLRQEARADATPAGRRAAAGGGQSTRPGFSTFAGSSARLIERISSSATGDLRRARWSRLMRPMPCSAENDPRHAATASYTSSLTRASNSPTKSSAATPSGACTL